MLLAVRLGLRSTPLLLATGLAASGVAAAVAFWAFYAEPSIGKAFAYLVPLGSVAAIVACLHGGRIERRLLRALATPLALWALGSAFLVFFGFLHGGTSEPLEMASTRFSSKLPPDNVIPGFFADWFFEHGHRGTPPVFPGDWLSSDRPPLQVGYVLSQRGFGWDDHGLHTQILGVILQQLWIVGLWALLVAARVGRVTRGLVVVTVLVSDLALVNGFFIWPKLLPAAFLLAATALVATPLWDAVRRDRRGAILLAGLLGLALLGHGSSAFAVVPLALLALVRGLPDWRWIAVGAAVGLALLLPWSAYQKYGDPPGNRLTKWMLGGAYALDDRSTGETVVDGYREAGLSGTLENKLRNVGTIVGNGPAAQRLADAFAALPDDPTAAMRELRELFFFQLLPSLGLLAIAPFAMAYARIRGRPDSPEWRLAVACWAIVLVGCAFWSLVLFGSPTANASIHVGSLMIPVLAFCGAVCGLRAVYPRFATYYAAIAAALMLALYVPAFDPVAGTAYSPLAALLAAACLAGFIGMAFVRQDPSASANTLAR
ncbi:MAG: hypothetical protein WA687_05260 [Solirubrobacterales bacterium]